MKSNSTWLAQSSLPLSLRGFYEKEVLLRGSEVYLFKAYPRQPDASPGAAEVAASRFYQLFDPAHSVEVSPFVWNGVRGTIQPFLSKATALDRGTILSSSHTIAAIRARQVLDWVVSNHDNHSRHILAHGPTLKFVDYGQAFKYFPNDSLSSDYHPNSALGQDPPIHTFIPRPLQGQSPPEEVVKMCVAVSLAPKGAIHEALDYYAKTQYPTARGRFLELVENRIENLTLDFAAYYRGEKAIE